MQRKYKTIISILIIAALLIPVAFVIVYWNEEYVKQATYQIIVKINNTVKYYETTIYYKPKGMNTLEIERIETNFTLDQRDTSKIFNMFYNKFNKKIDTILLILSGNYYNISNYYVPLQYVTGGSESSGYGTIYLDNIYYYNFYLKVYGQRINLKIELKPDNENTGENSISLTVITKDMIIESYFEQLFNNALKYSLIMLVLALIVYLYASRK